MSDNEKDLRDFYQKLLHIAKENDAIVNGNYEVLRSYNDNKNQFAFIRISKKEDIVVLANFDREKSFSVQLSSFDYFTNHHYPKAKELLSDKIIDVSDNIEVAPSGVVILKLIH